MVGFAGFTAGAGVCAGRRRQVAAQRDSIGEVVIGWRHSGLLQLVDQVVLQLQQHFRWFLGSRILQFNLLERLVTHGERGHTIPSVGQQECFVGKPADVGGIAVEEGVDIGKCQVPVADQRGIARKERLLVLELDRVTFSDRFSQIQ